MIVQVVIISQNQPPLPPHPLPPRLLAASWTKVHIALALNPKSSKGAIEPQETVY